MFCLLNKSVITLLIDLYLYLVWVTGKFCPKTSFSNSIAHLLHLDTMLTFAPTYCRVFLFFFLCRARFLRFNDESCYNFIRNSSFYHFYSPKMTCFVVRLYPVTTRSLPDSGRLTPDFGTLYLSYLSQILQVYGGPLKVTFSEIFRFLNPIAKFLQHFKNGSIFHKVFHLFSVLSYMYAKWNSPLISFS